MRKTASALFFGLFCLAVPGLLVLVVRWAVKTLMTVAPSSQD
jgi:hypothetical protein